MFHWALSVSYSLLSKADLTSPRTIKKRFICNIVHFAFLQTQSHLLRIFQTSKKKVSSAESSSVFKEQKCNSCTGLEYPMSSSISKSFMARAFRATSRLRKTFSKIRAGFKGL